MPQPALTVFLIIAAIAIVVVLIAVIVIALRAQRRRKLAQTLEKRRDDEVQYAFIVNPSKPQAEARRLHIQRFCEAKGLNRIRFYDTQLDKDGRVCALEALEDGADVVIACLGESADMSGEGYCRSELGLPGVQQELLKELKKTGKPVVLLLSNGRPLTLAWEKENIETIVETWFLGTEAGNAVADVLFGKYNPSGKLVMSFPYNVGQIPVYYNHKHTGRPFEPNQRYVMHYIDAPVDALYPFGYGLSYTTFEYGDLRPSATTLRRGEKVTVEVSVTNTGGMDGAETVHWFISDPVCRISRPVRELKHLSLIHI